MQGAASGIGFETVKAFLEAGATGVTLVDLSSDALATAIANLAEIGEGRTLSFNADVSDEVGPHFTVQVCRRGAMLFLRF
jgi:NAD(P)-dependent dehydrogenase (short-subunit alcohol dehydrogenase family)